MLAFPVSYGLMHFHIPAAKVNDIAAWILLADEIYMRDEINRRGSATVIRYQGKNGFKHIAEIPKTSGTAQPYYGTIGGAYHFFFEIREHDVALRVEHFDGRRLNIEPYAVTLGDFPQFETQSESSSHWYMNRVEFLIEKRNQDYRMYIDGEMYANMLAVGWQQRYARQYRYEFIPTQVGCIILIHRISTGEIFDVTKDFEW